MQPLTDINFNAIKLVVSDLDGTLLDANHKLTNDTKQTVKALVEHGYQFMIATGRHYQDVYLIAEQLGVEVSLITSNGARVHNHHAELVYENHMSSQCVERVLSISAGFKVHRNLYQQDLWLVEEPHESLLAIHHESGFEYQITDFNSLDLNHIDKIYFTAEHDLLVDLEQKLKAELNDKLNITFTSPEYLEVMNKGVNKGEALQKLLKLKGLQANQVLAFGDGMNDVEMLKLAECGVVMHNASDKVKSALPNLLLAMPNSENGVAKFVNQYLLG